MPETPTPSPQLLRSQAVAREIKATLSRIEGKIERYDATITRVIGELRDEWRGEGGGLRCEIEGLRSDFRWLIGTTLAGFCVVLGALARGFGWW